MSDVVGAASEGTEDVSTRRRQERGAFAFQVFVALLVVFTLFGIARVYVLAQVSEAIVKADALQAQVEQEERIAQVLEVQKSALANPDRLSSIAVSTLCMSQPEKTGYVQLAADAASTKPACAPEGTHASSEGLVASDGEAGTSGSDEHEFGMRDFVALMMDMAAGEARVLLVGDVSLASSR